MLGAPVAMAQQSAPQPELSKPATAATQAANLKVQQSLPFQNKADFENAQKGFIATPKTLTIKDAKGRVIWDLEAYKAYIGLDKPAPDTVNPSLWRNAQLGMLNGLFEVTDGIYQVRGYDLSNITFVRTKSGWIVFDPLISPETSKAAYDLVTEQLGKRPIRRSSTAIATSPGTRLGLTYTSVIDLDFSGRAKFSGIGPILNLLLQSRGLLDARVDVGAKVPQQVMGSVYTEIDDRWALMGNVGWQDWSEFGEVEIGIDNTQNPVSLTNPLSFDDTWHVAMGAQYRPNDQWKVNVGLAYDSGFQDGNDVSPLFPVNSAWRFGVGGEREASESFKWGFTTELLYGGNIDVDKRSTLPPVLGGRGNLVGSYDQTLSVVLTVYGNWAL
jgi:hypothetical protein